MVRRPYRWAIVAGQTGRSNSWDRRGQQSRRALDGAARQQAVRFPPQGSRVLDRIESVQQHARLLGVSTLLLNGPGLDIKPGVLELKAFLEREDAHRGPGRGM